MNSIKKWNIWNGILDTEFYLKIPDGFWKLFSRMGFKGWDFPVLFYLFSKTRENNMVVEIDEHIIFALCECPRERYFSSMRKIKNILNLKRVRSRFYDMEPVLTTLKETASSYLTNQ